MRAGAMAAGFVGHCLRVAGVALIVAAGAEAAAQPAFELRPAEQSVACLTSIQPDQKIPAFAPDSPLSADVVVRLQLHFDQPTMPPVVKVLASNGSGKLLLAVRDHVLNYRLACLKPHLSVDAVQEFRLLAGDPQGQVQERALLEREARFGLPEECLAGIRSAPPPVFERAIPLSLKTIVRLTFNAPDAPPDVLMLFDSGPPGWTAAVLASIGTYRLPCVTPFGGPYIGEGVFAFMGYNTASRVPEGQRTGITLEQFVSLLKRPREQPVRFDLAAMACPFQLSFELFQPYMQNKVRQVGEVNDTRQEFTRWMRSVAFNISDNNLRGVMGDPVTVSVPCGVLDLT